MYAVVVGNIGTVYSGGRFKDAQSSFRAYTTLSQDGCGRAAGESVTWFKNDEIVDEHFGSNNYEQEDQDCLDVLVALIERYGLERVEGHVATYEEHMKTLTQED